MKWLHLSDLHYLYKNYETDVMRDSFITYLDETFSGTIDILFITGILLIEVVIIQKIYLFFRKYTEKFGD